MYTMGSMCLGHGHGAWVVVWSGWCGFGCFGPDWSGLGVFGCILASGVYILAMYINVLIMYN